MARPQRTTLVAKDRATVILVVDVSRSMESKDVKP
jgi:Mg-chelatase subunit ChlD